MLKMYSVHMLGRSESMIYEDDSISGGEQKRYEGCNRK